MRLLVSLPDLISVREHFRHMIMFAKITTYWSEMIAGRVKDRLSLVVQTAVPTHESYLVFFQPLHNILHLLWPRIVGGSKERYTTGIS